MGGSGFSPSIPCTEGAGANMVMPFTRGASIMLLQRIGSAGLERLRCHPLARGITDCVSAPCSAPTVGGLSGFLSRLDDYRTRRV